jgi:hypothetical protein
MPGGDADDVGQVVEEQQAGHGGDTPVPTAPTE